MKHRSQIRYLTGLCLIFTIIFAVNLPAFSATGSFVSRDNDIFVLDGKPFYIAGANNHYLQFAPKAEVDRVLADAAAMKLNVLRIWGFLDIGSSDGTVPTVWSSYGPNAYDLNTKGVYFQSWDPEQNKPVYNDGPNGLQKLDYVVAKAGQLGIKLIIVLTNNWQHMGGIPQYMTWYYLDRSYEFYINEKTRQAYKDWVTHVVTRENTQNKLAYRDDPTILGWELINEPHCDNVSTKVLTNWITEMSAHIKQLDNRHLIGLGDEGFFNRENGTGSAYNGSSGLDFDANLKIPTIDFGTYHLYPDWWKTTPEWGAQYIKDHIDSGKAIGKPVVLGEFGWQNDGSKEKVYGQWLDTIYKENGAGWMFWRLVAPAENGTRPVDNDHFDIYYPSGLATSLTNWAQLFAKKGNVSANSTVSTGESVPGEFKMTFPGNGTSKVTTLPAFTWENSAGATRYEVVIAADSSFDITVSTSVTLENKYTPTTPLSYSKTYFWKVIALNDAGKQVAANAGLSFTTENMPRVNLIDDFEEYDGSNYALNTYYIRNKDGNNVKVSLDTINKNDGKFGIKYEYTLTNPGFCGLVRQKLRNTNWLGATGIQFWLKPDGSDHYFTIQFQETNGEAWEYGFKLAGSKDGKIYQIPIENFGKPGWCKVGDNKLNLKSISTFSIYMGKGNGDTTGAVYIDSIALIGNLETNK